MQRAEAAYRRMFEGKSKEELVTLTQRESMAVLIGKELAAFLLEEHVATDPAAQPVEASTTCCPKCGQPGTPAVEEAEELSERAVTTRVGQIRVRRQRWECGKCRIVFFSAGRSAGVGDGRL
jgi:ribosomal protein S27AE